MTHPVIKYKHSLSIIIPLYNEAELITSTVDQITAFLSPRLDRYEIIIVESGSTDSSSEICEQLAIMNDHIKLIHEGARNGYGSGLRLGTKFASNEYIWIITADLPFDLIHMDTAMLLLDNYSCVLSFRSQDKRSHLRKIQSLIYNFIVKHTLGLPFKHMNSAFKVLPTELFQNLELISNGWFIDVEVLFYINRSKISYIEIPVPLIDRSKGKSNIGATTFLNVLNEMAKFKKSH
jgi:glycosyltransferase involved in cell wall biosynthesis